MGEDKQSKKKQNSGNPEGKPDQLKSIEDQDILRRFDKLEDKIGKVESSLLDRHTKTITIIFSCMAGFVAVCSILVTILGILSKSSADDAAKEMKADVREKLKDFEQRFQALAGESLRKAVVEIYSGSEPLEGKVFDAVNGSADFGTLFVKNTGNKSTERISVRLFSSSTLSIGPNAWFELPSSDKEFPSAYYRDHGEIIIAAQETWSIATDLLIRPAAIGQTNILGKLQVFYGGEKPAEAHFNIRVR